MLRLSSVSQHITIDKVFIIGIVGIIFFFYHGWFEPGVLIGPDFQVRPSEFFAFFSQPSIWMSSLYGGASVVGVSNASSPVYYLAAFLSNLLTYEYLQRVLWLFPFLIVSFLSFRFLIRKFITNTYAIYTSVLFFLINPIILERLANGQVWMAMAYAFFPLVMGIFIDAMKTKSYLRQTILLGLAYSVIVWYEPRVALLATIPIFAYAIFHLISHMDRTSLVKVCKVFALSSLIVVLLNVYWIAPLIGFPVKLYDSTLASEGALRGVSQYAGNLFNSLQIYPLNWNESYTPFALVVPILAFSLLLTYHNRNALILILSSFALILIFLGKGSFEPFGGLYLWIMQNIPLAVAFRNSNKFWFVLALLYGILLAFIIEFSLNKPKVSERKFLGLFVICFVVISIIISDLYFINGILQTFPIADTVGWERYNKQFTMFNPTNQTQFAQLNDAWEYIKMNSTIYSRTLWLPTIHGYRFGTEDHPALSSTLFGNPQFPYNYYFIFGPNGEISRQAINYDLAAMLSLGRIEHIILPEPDFANWQVSRTSYDTFKKILDSQNMIDVSRDTKLPIAIDRANVLTSGTLILNNNTLTFQSMNDSSALRYNIPEALHLETISSFSLSLREDRPETITITFTDRGNNSVHQNIRTNENWKEYSITFKNSGAFDWERLASIKLSGIYGGSTIELKDLKLNNGLRIYKVENAVPVAYSPTNVILTNDEIADALSYSRNGTLDIREAAFVNKNSLSSNLEEILQSIKNQNDNLLWKRIDSNKFEVEVSNSAPRVIVFTESFDPNWHIYINNDKMPNEFHFMVNGYANGFYIDKLGSFKLTIEYEPQSWFYLGTQISLAAFTVIVAYLIWNPAKMMVAKRKMI